ncbi:MAG: DUF1697 domain-containing protein [Flavobacteriales bacterium]|jgi:uncharacterized protein (DUF1697 family)|nr:DUF1697 domain-containing protein [Flavobacteriales bacterium]
MTQDYIIFIRAINVGGTNIVKMKELKEILLNNPQLVEVKTYIQSGNILIKTALSKIDLKKFMLDVLEKSFGINTHLFVYTKGEYLGIIQDVQSGLKEDIISKFYLVIFSETTIEQPLELSYLQKYITNEKLFYFKKVLSVYFENGVGKSKLDLKKIERQFNFKGTGRNLNTIFKMEKMLEEF